MNRRIFCKKNTSLFLRNFLVGACAGKKTSHVSTARVLLLLVFLRTFRRSGRRMCVVASSSFLYSGFTILLFPHNEGGIQGRVHFSSSRGSNSTAAAWEEKHRLVVT